MPIYEYQCQHCHTEFELMRKMAQSDQVVACPECASMETRRKVSQVTAFVSSGGEQHAAAGGGGCGCGSCGGSHCGTCHH